MLRPAVRRAIVLLAVFGATVLLTAGTVAADTGYRIRVERVDTLSYPVVRFVASVTDADGKPVRGLDASSIRLTEDGTAIPAAVDLASQTTAVALAFVLDSSASMAGAPLQQAIEATVSLTQRLGARDQAAILTYRDEAVVVRGLTSDKQAISAAARSVAPQGSLLATWSAFDDALVAAGDVLRTAAPGTRGAIVLVTDGFSSSSAAADKERAIERARGSLYPIYAVAVGQQLDRATFTAIGTASGGKAFFAPTASQLGAAYNEVSEQLLTQYSIAYVTAHPGAPGTGRSVTLSLVREGAVLAQVVIAYAIPASSSGVTGAAAPGAAPEAPTDSVTFVAKPPPVQQADLPTGDLDLSLNAGAVLALMPAVASPATGVAVLGAAAVLALFLFIMNGVLPSAIRLRLDRFVVPPRVQVEETEEKPPADRARYARGFFVAIGKRVARVVPRSLVESSGQVLENFGDPMGLGGIGFIGVRAVTAVGGAIAAFAGGLGLGLDTVAAAAMLAPVGMVLGFVAPVMFLGMKINGRKKQILRSLPSTVDILALSVEAGLAFDGAIAQIVMRRKNAIADEFRRVLVEFQMGRPRRDALRELAVRTGVPEVGRLTNAVIQADALGAPLSKALSDLSQELRTRRRQRAEELARTAPIKMLFPMVGLIFPSLFIIILGPAVPRLMSIFSTVGK